MEKALQFNPDLVITDIMMPEMDGIEFCNQLKKNINISHIPIIMLTAKNSPEHELEGLENGADYYITKPFNIEHLKLIIKNALHTREHFQLKFNGLKLPEPSEVTTTSPDEILLKKIAETLEKYISDPELSNEKLAQECDLSPAQLYRKIKALTRMSTHKFIRSFRLKRAAQLLVQNKLRISEVAYMVGFCDPKYFRKCFKEEFGMSPTAYSKSHALTDTTI